MGNATLIFALVAATATGVSIPRAEVAKQNSVFEQWWYDDFVWEFDELPASGAVAEHRVPYSGYIYLDKHGGTASVMEKYDAALNRGYPATAWERSDTSGARKHVGGFFRSRTVVNHWYGHCNGWSSAAIRHAEPEHAVSMFGMRFTPADIKGLLAEIYMYNDIEMLAGFEQNLNAGTLHAVLANWLGRGHHPIAMDSDPGEEKWNYPVYGFASKSSRRSSRQVEVRTNIIYAKDNEDREHDQSPHISKQKSFHYMLELDGAGDIIGGYYFNDSDRIDFVWVPVSPKEPGQTGNESGNPHLSVDKVLAIWRKSVSAETRKKWLVIDPASKDRSVVVADPNRPLPRNIRIVPPTQLDNSFDDEELIGGGGG